jgi:hypothetical protein
MVTKQSVALDPDFSSEQYSPLRIPGRIILLASDAGRVREKRHSEI